MVTIAHAAALTEEDALPFAHSVALARSSGAELVAVHASNDPSAESRMLDAKAVLEGWGENADAVPYRKLVHSCCDDPVDTTLDALRGLTPDLVVAGTHQREGIVRLVLDSRAEAIAQNVAAPTLIVPIGARGFVAGGQLRLRRILVPAGDAAAAEAGCEAARWMIDLSKAPVGELILMHVGEGEVPGGDPNLPEGWSCNRESADGKLEEILGEASKEVDLIVMATRGRDSVHDAIVGSHTERVFHRADCPVLSVHLA